MATLPAPRTWTVGELLSAVKMNTDVRDGLNFLLSPPLAVLRLTADVSIANNSLTNVSWNSEAIDRDGGHDNATNPIRYTAQTAGWYEISGNANFGNSSTGIRVMFLHDQGGTNISGNVASGNSAGMPSDLSTSKTHFLNVGDFFTMTVYQNSGGALNLWATPAPQSQMAARWVSKA